MPIYYYDTSVIIKHYHLEVGSIVVDRLLEDPESSHFISRLVGVELESAFAKTVRLGVITQFDSKIWTNKKLTNIRCCTTCCCD